MVLKLVIWQFGQCLVAVFSDNQGMFPLCGEAAVLGDYGPAIIEHFHLAFAGIDHGLDSKGHAGFNNDAGAGCAVVQHLGFFMEDFADAVAAVFAHDGEIIGLGMLLNGVADIAEMDARFDHFDAQFHAFVTDAADALGENTGLADKEHLASVAVVAVLNDGDVDIDDVAVFQFFVAGDAVTNLVIHRSTDGFRKAVIVQRGRDRLLHVYGVVVADFVQLVGGDPGFDVFGDHSQLLGSQLAGNTHFFNLFGGFQSNAHIVDSSPFCPDFGVIYCRKKPVMV